MVVFSRKSSRRVVPPVRHGRVRRKELAEFEKLLSELSSSFIRAPVEEVDTEIERWLERVVLAVGVDRASVVQVDPTDKAIYTTHQWARPGMMAPHRGLRINVASILPWTASQILSGKMVVLARLEDLPPEASKDRDTARLADTKSNVTIPIRIGGIVVGAVFFGTLVEERPWSQREIRHLRLVAETFGNALERKRSEAVIRRLSDELRQVSQVVTIDEMTASLAHELNQPLGAILNNAGAARLLLAAKVPDLKEIDTALEDIIRDDERAVEIVQKVRSLFQRGDAKLSSLDMKALLVEVSRIANLEAKRRDIFLSKVLPDSLPPVRGDKTHLMQAVLNLVLNAFDAVCESEGPREVELAATGNDTGCVQVSVQDSGKGIDPKIMPHLFDPFFTTKPTGMGMGLTIVRSIVENHGGRVWARPNPDRGTTMEIALPVAGAEKSEANT